MSRNKVDKKLWNAGARHLRPGRREVVYLRRQGLTFGDIADKIGASEDAVRGWYYQAQDKLYGMLELPPEHSFWEDYCGEVGAVEATALEHLREVAKQRKNKRKRERKRLKYKPPHLIKFFSIPRKTKNALLDAEIYTIFRIQEMTRDGFLELKNISKRSLEHVIETLEDEGFDASNLKP